MIRFWPFRRGEKPKLDLRVGERSCICPRCGKRGSLQWKKRRRGKRVYTYAYVAHYRRSYAVKWCYLGRNLPKMRLLSW
jgi:hypothetical protein